jgi:membrane-bound serine protease (ClpP class)
LKRAFRDIGDDADALTVLEIDTFGGRVDSALDMVDTLVNRSGTIAYVKTKALSAGALIALACNELAMRNNTTIGDCAPISYSSEGPQELGEKFQSPLRAQFRALAKRNGYPEALAEAMVTVGMEVYEVVTDDQTSYMETRELESLTEEEKNKIRSKRIVVAEDELLTMNDSEAREFGFSKMSVTSVEEMLSAMGIAGYELVRMETSWSEGLSSLIGSIAPILMLIGLGAIFTELKAPGFGVPGVVGILCLAAVFLNQYLVGLADYTELLLLGFGVVLLGFELFVTPGFGLLGIAGLFLMAVGLLLGLQDFVIPDPSFPWQKELFVHNAIQVAGSLLFALAVPILFLRYALPRLSRVVEGPYLDATLEDAHVDSRDTHAVTVGDRGLAMTPLRPSGKMKKGTQMLDVITRGEFLEKETAIRVIEIAANRVIVAREDSDGK